MKDCASRWDLTQQFGPEVDRARSPCRESRDALQVLKDLLLDVTVVHRRRHEHATWFWLARPRGDTRLRPRLKTWLRFRLSLQHSFAGSTLGEECFGFEIPSSR